MSTKAEVIALIAGLITDNTNGENNALRARTALGHIVENTFNVDDDVRDTSPKVVWSGVVNAGSLVREIYRNPAITSVDYSSFGTFTEISFNGVTVDYENDVIISVTPFNTTGTNLSGIIGNPTSSGVIAGSSGDRTMVTIHYNGNL